MTLKIHVDHLIDAISKNCPYLERLEFRWDNDTLRFSDKNQKAVDMLRTKCLQMQSLVLSDGKLYEIMRGNFERADRRAVIRTEVLRDQPDYIYAYGAAYFKALDEGSAFVWDQR